MSRLIKAEYFNKWRSKRSLESEAVYIEIFDKTLVLKSTMKRFFLGWMARKQVISEWIEVSDLIANDNSMRYYIFDVECFSNYGNRL